jgi:hypothetical protein
MSLYPNLLIAGLSFTNEQIDGQIYPYWTYSYLVLLVPVFVLTDLVRYKPMLLVESAALVGTWVLIIWGALVV